MKQRSITTKKGDGGQTELLDNSRVAKYDLRPEAYGSLDEAAAWLGLVRAKSKLDVIKKFIWLVQNHIYLINSELACPRQALHLLKHTIDDRQLQQVESFAQEIEKKLELPRKFIIYGQTEISAILDIARAIVRRTERRVIELNNQQFLANKTILAYLNRLSDALYLLARYDEYAHNVPYAHPDDV